MDTYTPGAIARFGTQTVASKKAGSIFFTAIDALYLHLLFLDGLTAWTLCSARAGLGCPPCQDCLSLL